MHCLDQPSGDTLYSNLKHTKISADSCNIGTALLLNRHPSMFLTVHLLGPPCTVQISPQVIPYILTWLLAKPDCYETSQCLNSPYFVSYLIHLTFSLILRGDTTTTTDFLHSILARGSNTTYFVFYLIYLFLSLILHGGTTKAKMEFSHFILKEYYSRKLHEKMVLVNIVQVSYIVSFIRD